MGKRTARTLLLLGLLFPVGLAVAQGGLMLPTFTPEEKARLEEGRRLYPPVPEVAVTPEMDAALAGMDAAGKNSMRAAEIGEQFNKLICENVKTDVTHSTPGYQFVEDRARACVDDVNLTRNLGLLKPPEAVQGGTAMTAEHKAYLACMAQECENRVMVQLFSPRR